MDAFRFTANSACRTIEKLDRRIGQRRDATRAPIQVRNGWRPHGRRLTQPARPSKDSCFFVQTMGSTSTLDRKKAVNDAPRINDFLAENIARHPSRFGGFATLPMQSAPDAANELERCVKQLGFHGALINGHTHGHYLDEDQYEVFWERVADLNVPIY